MKWLFFLLLTPLLLQAADEKVTWSQPVKGLRARLFISPSRDPDFDYSYQVYLQFENIGVVGNLGTTREERTFQYREEGGLALDVTDAKGQKLPINFPAMIDYISRGWNLCLPWGGNLAFPIGNISGAGQKHLKIMPFRTWDLPAAISGNYYLSGTFSFNIKDAMPHVPAGIHPTLRDSGILLNWEGTLVLPPIKIPAQ